MNAGFFMFNQRLFDFLGEGDVCDIETEALGEINEREEQIVKSYDRLWVFMNPSRDDEYLNDLFRRSMTEWKVW